MYIKMVYKYYQKHNERLQKEAHERYQNLSEKEKWLRAKKGSRKISKFYWRRKGKEGSVLSGM